MLAVQQEQQQPGDEKQQVRHYVVHVDASAAAQRERRGSGSHASASGRASGGWPAEPEADAVAAARLSQHDGSASAPLEVGSPLKAPAAAAATVTTGLPAAPEPSVADEAHARGYSLCKERGDHAGAVLEYTTALEEDPFHFRSLFYRAFSRDKLGDLAGAQADYRAALVVDPSCRCVACCVCGWSGRQGGEGANMPRHILLDTHTRPLCPALRTTTWASSSTAWATGPQRSLPFLPPSRSPQQTPTTGTTGGSRCARW